MERLFVKKLTVLLAVATFGMSAMENKETPKEVVVVGEVKLSLTNKGSVGFIVRQGEDLVNPTCGLYSGQKGFCGNQIEAEIGRLVGTSEMMGLSFINANRLQGPGFFKRLLLMFSQEEKIWSQHFEELSDGTENYVGPDDTKELFQQESRKILGLFKTLQQHQREWKQQHSLEEKQK